MKTKVILSTLSVSNILNIINIVITGMDAVIFSVNPFHFLGTKRDRIEPLSRRYLTTPATPTAPQKEPENNHTGDASWMRTESIKT